MEVPYKSRTLSSGKVYLEQRLTKRNFVASRWIITRILENDFWNVFLKSITTLLLPVKCRKKWFVNVNAKTYALSQLSGRLSNRHCKLHNFHSVKNGHCRRNCFTVKLDVTAATNTLKQRNDPLWWPADKEIADWEKTLEKLQAWTVFEGVPLRY